LEDEAPAFAEADDFFHSGGRSIFGHKCGMKPQSRRGVNAAVVLCRRRFKSGK
jgi:hypothetical protein